MMEMIVPKLYMEFSCKAGACQHNCCRESWEIDVDPDSAERYFQMTGSLGKALKESIVQDNEGYHIRSNEAGSCPLLRPDGLCRLAMELGPDNLCDICALHPRFYELLSGSQWDFELGGMGLCCERTCELLLADEKPLQFCFDEDENKLFNFQEVLAKIAVTLPAKELAFHPNLKKEYVEFVLKALAKTEPIDDEWTKHMEDLQEQADTIYEKMVAAAPHISKGLFDKIYQYILYRQLEQIVNTSTAAVLAFAQLNTEFVWLDSLVTGNLPEALRRWSEQIEYDTENVDLLLRKEL